MRTAAKRCFSTCQWNRLRDAAVDQQETEFDSTTSIVSSLPQYAFETQGSSAVRMRFVGRADGATGTFDLFGINYRIGLDSRQFDPIPAYFVTPICSFAVSTGAATTLDEIFLDSGVNLVDEIVITSVGSAAYERQFGDSANTIVDSWNETDGWAELVAVNPGFQWMHVQFSTLVDIGTVNGVQALVIET